MDNKKIVLAALGAFILALLIFHAGVVVGSRHHARGGRAFSGRWELPHGFVEGGHGAIGTIESVATSSLTLMTRGGQAETVMFASGTAVHAAGSATSSAALMGGEHVLVLGTPDAAGRLVADVIRILR